MLWVTVVVLFVDTGWLTADAAILDGVQHFSGVWLHQYTLLQQHCMSKLKPFPDANSSQVFLNQVEY